MKHIPGKLLALLLLLALAGCGGPTPYKPMAGGDYGYQDLLLQKDRYRVSFKGNSDTSRDTVENYLLYRAAELTLATGNRYFVQVNGDTDKSTTYIGNSGIGLGGFYQPFGFGFGLSTSQPSSKYTAFAIIDVSKSRPSTPNAYDAHQVIKNLQPLIQAPKK